MVVHPSPKKNHHPLPDRLSSRGWGERRKVSLRKIEQDYRFDLTNLVNKYGYDVIPGLIKELGSQERLKRRFAADMLVHLGRPAKEDLIQALKDGNPLVRQQSARVLGQIGDESADKPLSKLLKDSNINVRRAAQEALNQLKK